jgi:hypothetical protein
VPNLSSPDETPLLSAPMTRLTFHYSSCTVCDMPHPLSKAWPTGWAPAWSVQQDYSLSLFWTLGDRSHWWLMWHMRSAGTTALLLYMACWGGWVIFPSPCSQWGPDLVSLLVLTPSLSLLNFIPVEFYGLPFHCWGLFVYLFVFLVLIWKYFAWFLGAK